MRKQPWAMLGLAILAGVIILASRGTAQDKPSPETKPTADRPREDPAAHDSDGLGVELRRGTMTEEQWKRGYSELRKKRRKALRAYELAASRAKLQKAEADKAEAEMENYELLNPQDAVVKKP